MFHKKHAVNRAVKMVGVNRAWNQKLVWTWTWTTAVWIERLKPSIIKPSICSFKQCCQPWPMNETMHVAEGWQQGTFLPCGRVAVWNAETGKLCRPGSSQSVIPMSERIDSSSSFWSVPCPEQKETIYTISLNRGVHRSPAAQATLQLRVP